MENRAGLSYTIFKMDHRKTIPYEFAFNWINDFWEDFNVIIIIKIA
jgi:hypothetical protein